MATAPGSAWTARAPLWVRASRVLEIVTLVVIGLAVGVEASLAVIARNPAGLVAAGTIAAGTVIGYRFQPYVGLALVAASPLVAVFVGWLPIHNWSMACFAVLLLTLRGLPGVIGGVVTGLASFAAVGWHGGGLSVNDNPEAWIAVAAVLMCAAIGSAIRGQRRYLAELEQRTRDAIVTREAAVERSVAEERVRIARDLHDSVGHKIAVVSMHLGAAEVHLPTDAAAVAVDLAEARAGVQSVLRETQEILRVLRVGVEPDSVTPTPEHSRIPDLLASFQTAGLEVDARFTGLERSLGQTTSAAAYRITQEALTNAEKHGTGPVSLRVDVTPAQVTIEVVNLRGAAGAGTSGGGNGLVGMRERAASAGGRIEVRSDDRLFSVRAWLPVEEEENR
ncbi:sensor histidine kinase [Propionicicella superfundia]|uniref:sensor histidine kinase n=1 Tax=Propionicicella superfundia TaxID=348582 RepID=UPI0004202681|nr:histidine kinase [Propionicicella superfundia]